jgi:hypothetical protein
MALKSRRVMLIEVDEDGSPREAAIGYRFEGKLRVTTDWKSVRGMTVGEVCGIIPHDFAQLGRARSGK